MPKKIAVVLCLLALCGISCTDFTCMDSLRSLSGGETSYDWEAKAKLYLRIEE